MLKILMCGDRNWQSRETIEAVIRTFAPGTVVIHGAARGADRISGEVAQAHGFTVLEFPADWGRYGRGAGPKRNIEMLDQQPHMVIAFHHDLASSRGTAHTVREARKRGIPVVNIKE